MSLLSRLQSVFILLAVACGLTLGQVAWIAERASALILPALMLMLIGVFLEVPLRQLVMALRHRRFTALNLGVNFLWTPILGWALGGLFLFDSPDLRVGFLMLLVTPCTDWYLVFTSIARGNVATAATQLPWHLVMQLLLLPVYLLVFAGTLVPLQFDVLVWSMIVVLAVPLAAAEAVRLMVRHESRGAWFERVVRPRLGNMQVVALLVAIAAMFASQGELLVSRPDLLFELLPALLAFYAVNLVLSAGLSKAAGFDRGAAIAFSFATLARNSPVSLAVAVTAFPDRPLIALSLVIGPLIELPTLALLSQWLRWRSRPRLAGTAVSSSS